MSFAFNQADKDSHGGKVPVWSDPDGKALLFITGLHVNTDGTPRSYSTDDFWGTTNAINNLCNAMGDACAGLNSAGLQHRREITQAAAAANWPADALKATKIDSAIIAFKNGKPCPPVSGFLVSETALAKPNITDQCDITNYVDALEVPAFVLPGKPKNGSTGFSERGTAVGDLGVAMRSAGAAPIFLVAGDTGPVGLLGEGSVALNGKLLGKTSPPANYNEIRGKHPFEGKGWDVGEAAVLIFPKTKNAANPYMTSERIDTDAGKLFADWGGADRLSACIAAYKAH